MLFFFIVVQVLCEELLFFLRCGFGLFLFCLALFLQVLEQKGEHKEEKADRPDGKAHGDIADCAPARNRSPLFFGECSALSPKRLYLTGS